LLGFLTPIAKAFLTEIGYESASLGMQVFGGHGYVSEWGELTVKLGVSAMKNREEIGAASVDYLMYSGYAVFAYLWAQMAKMAQDKLAEGSMEELFYNAKLQTARFYFTRMLPRTKGHAVTMLAGADTLLDMPEEAFIL